MSEPTRDLFLLFLVLGSFLHGGLIIEGKTLNLKTGNPVVGVNIFVESSDAGTVSDDSGNFVIEANGQDGIVAGFDHIAYETLYIPFTDSRSGVMVRMNEVLLQMDDVVVTSMRNNGHLLRDVPINTEVIGKREIQGSGALTISELLDQRAGVSNSVNVDGGSIFNLLGLDSRYILILRDGQPITGRFNGRVDLDQISLTGVKRIEITKGPGSALYGTDAMGGTINIITDDPSESSFMNMSYRSTTFGRTLKAIKNDHGNKSVDFENLTINTKIIIPGLPTAMYNAGATYEKHHEKVGLEDEEQAMREAVKWYQRGAEGGLELAQFSYGYALEYGLGGKTMIDKAIKAAKQRSESLDHTLLYGPPGLGKTTLAHVISHEMKSSIKVTSGPAIEKAGDLVSILTRLQKGDILFIDEIHRLNKISEEVLYSAMEEYRVSWVIEQGLKARSVNLGIQPFTLIGATTKFGMLSAPLRDRFGSVFRLNFYSDSEMADILYRSIKILKINSNVFII